MEGRTELIKFYSTSLLATRFSEAVGHRFSYGVNPGDQGDIDKQQLGPELALLLSSLPDASKISRDSAVEAHLIVATSDVGLGKAQMMAR